MSNKKPSINQKQEESKTNNNNNLPNTEAFSFLELDNFLSKEIIKKDNTNKNSKKNLKKKESSQEKDDKKQKLRLKPNKSLARGQTSDDLMYIEKDDTQEKKKDTSKEKDKEKNEEKDNTNNNITAKEKNIQKKAEIKNEKVDKRLVKINLDKEKSEEKSKNKKDEEDSKINKDQNKKQEVYDIESIINDIKEKDPKAYVPIVLPFKEEHSEKNLKEELNKENSLFIFQFPRQIPIKDLPMQTKAKEEENVNEEPNYDENGFLISQEFKNSFQELKDNTTIGKLVIMKSGKIKIKMGDIYLDIHEGSLTKFAQYSAIVTGNDDNQAFILGQPLNKKLIVTPEFD